MNAVSAVDRLGALAKTQKIPGVLDIPGFFWVVNRDLHQLHLFSNVFFCVGGWGNDLITLNKWFPNLSGSPNPK